MEIKLPAQIPGPYITYTGAESFSEVSKYAFEACWMILICSKFYVDK